MCGIAGFINRRGLPGDADVLVASMTEAIRHRGPDDVGKWLDNGAGVALGHRRLAVIDLSPAGHQPMVSESGRFVLVYNGEIYNHIELRAELSATNSRNWRGHSDTETLLALIERHGIVAALDKVNGMFAFAIWDREARTLTLARDRLGEKPLYYGFAPDGAFLFGSELKALTAYRGFASEIDREAVTQYLRHNYIPAPRSIWRGIAKLPPAHYVELPIGAHALPAPRCYWNFRTVASEGASAPLRDEPARTDELEALLMDAVGRRMAADVPLGAFLSGGIDSSLIVALMQTQSTERVRTFSIGFHEQGFNEAKHAKAVASHIGTDHTELYVTPDEARAVIPRLPLIWDEPFADSSQIPTLLVSEMTRRHVTVSLSGDGGDEMFGGYDRYHRAMRIWKALSSMSPAMKSALARVGRSGPARVAASLADRAFYGIGRPIHAADRLPKLANLLDIGIPGDLYRMLVSHWPDPGAIVLGAREPAGLMQEPTPCFADFRQAMMFFDTLSYLPDDILAKVDRASMAVSLEARVPFLDHRLVEFAWRLPMSAKMSGGIGKRILRSILYRHVPREIVDRPKMGFAVPIGDWLRGPLRDWAEDLLEEKRLREEGIFDPAPIRAKWVEHCTGKRRWHSHLWDVLMFQAWSRQLALGISC